MEPLFLFSNVKITWNCLEMKILLLLQDMNWIFIENLIFFNGGKYYFFFPSNEMSCLILFFIRKKKKGKKKKMLKKFKKKKPKINFYFKLKYKKLGEKIFIFNFIWYKVVMSFNTMFSSDLTLHYLITPGTG